MLVASFAEPVASRPGSFKAPSDLRILDRTEELNARTGEPEEMIVLGRKRDAPRATFIVAYLGKDRAAAPSDPRNAAVRIRTPFSPSLKATDAKAASIGEVSDAANTGTLPSGLVAQSYAVSNNRYRIVVLLKGAAAKPYGRLMESSSNVFEQFSWRSAVAPPAQPAAH
ncbi:hypothetical protein [Lysobacter korlensis]|uniref:hypothetical protein n=1 Tax=Lysobacter korlensis TaxID=553636 RepID=UPI0036D7C619